MSPSNTSTHTASQANHTSVASHYATPLNSAYPWRTFVAKVYFDRLGKVERASRQVSSGHPERDKQCMAYANALTIALPRLNTKMSGQVWRVIRIPPEAVLAATPNNTADGYTL